MKTWLEFNFHNCATMRVADDAPTASLLKDMFEPFLTSGLDQDRYDITVTGDLEPLQGVAYGEDTYQYTDRMVYIGPAKVQIVLDEGGFRLNGRGELLVWVLPLIDRVLATRNVAWIHAATVEYRGHGICLPAWGGVGKTSTIAKFLKLDDVGFMGDDWAFLSQDATLLGYAKPMFIKPHHRPIYPHLFQDKRKPLVPPRLSKPIGRLTTLVHPVVTQYPRLARVTRKWSPEHMMVAPRDAFPDARISTAAPLATAIFLERYDGSSPLLMEKDKRWMVSRLIGNFHAEITPQSQQAITALGAASLLPIEQYFQDKAAVLDRALEGKPVFLLQVPRAMSADQASDVIVEQIQKVLALSGIQGANGAGGGDAVSGNGYSHRSRLSAPVVLGAR